MEIILTSIMMSLPELILCILGAIHQNSEMMTEIVIGCMFFNLLVTGGICSMIRPVRLKQNLTAQQLPALIFVEIVVVYLAADYLLHGIHANRMISRTDGCILLILFCCLAWIDGKNISGEETSFWGQVKKFFSLKQGWRIFLGILLFGILAELFIREERNICEVLSVNQNILTLLIAAMVISLPKLVAVIAQVKKGKTEVIMEVIVRSNKIDTLFVLGLGAILCPIPVTMNTIYHFIVLCILSIVVWAFGTFQKEINRLHGCIMVTCYVSYMVFACIKYLY